MSVKQPVNPNYNTGQVVTPAAASAQITLPKGNKQVILTNLGANVCYVRIGTGTLTASTADFPVRAGDQVIVTKAMDDSTLAHISASGTTLQVITGDGWL